MTDPLYVFFSYSSFILIDILHNPKSKAVHLDLGSIILRQSKVICEEIIFSLKFVNLILLQSIFFHSCLIIQDL
ncbi:hypothetical protein HanRHA438_Chr13g0596401 [Helianthus annuus]|uniref:Uncharacterized protein n=1 Tax=Helianthus annuus TaxID=4232 RepID=A0A251SR38_HELAN|nr:hypothetical protein HanXRQr2_Chr13g0585691 [Helianthus annuus]KAJ0476690.1 hypothetical protein HanHA300_Chr13g0480141 [Helianthus annuus]KAJ0480992.1 hypothetical protein HanIR_Chr13g0637761 [Helianthus annuus]KAJ0497512.1 hypothetical protein HanHA89_Chr13g0512181 [Helianthus annuus]KAJ0663528.1 hypothetical protein HanLR1_Chr13g0482191 [Helianthus annuus]